MAISQAEVVDYIKNLKLSEVKALVETLEKELGVEASAPVMMGAMPAAGAAAAPAAEEEKTEFTVVLKDAGAKKIDVIKAVKTITGLGLKEAKDLVEGAPKELKVGIGKEEAMAAKKALEESGATVEIK